MSTFIVRALAEDRPSYAFTVDYGALIGGNALLQITPHLYTPTGNGAPCVPGSWRSSGHGC